MINEVSLQTKMGVLQVRLNDHDTLPDVGISLHRDGEVFDLAIVEVDQFDTDDMSVNLRTFEDPRHVEPTHHATIFEERFTKEAVRREKKKEEAQ